MEADRTVLGFVEGVVSTTLVDIGANFNAFITILFLELGVQRVEGQLIVEPIVGEPVGEAENFLLQVLQVKSVGKDGDFVFSSEEHLDEQLLFAWGDRKVFVLELVVIFLLRKLVEDLPLFREVPGCLEEAQEPDVDAVFVLVPFLCCDVEVLDALGIVVDLLGRHVFGLLDRVLAEEGELSGAWLDHLVEVQRVHSDGQDGGLPLIEGLDQIVVGVYVFLQGRLPLFENWQGEHGRVVLSG